MHLVSAVSAECCLSLDRRRRVPGAFCRRRARAVFPTAMTSRYPLSNIVPISCGAHTDNSFRFLSTRCFWWSTVKSVLARASNEGSSPNSRIVFQARPLRGLLTIHWGSKTCENGHQRSSIKTPLNNPTTGCLRHCQLLINVCAAVDGVDVVSFDEFLIFCECQKIFET